MTMMLLALLAVQAPAIERLDAPMPPGFKVGFQAEQGGQTIEERVPTAESVQDWTRMVTVQRLGGVASLGAPAFAERLIAMWIGSCPGATADKVATGEDRGVPTATVRVACPRNGATGKPETMFGRIFQGATDLHVVQYAFRATPDAGATAIAVSYIDSVHLSR